jgi:hypothetical protein
MYTVCGGIFRLKALVLVFAIITVLPPHDLAVLVKKIGSSTRHNAIFSQQVAVPSPKWISTSGRHACYIFIYCFTVTSICHIAGIHASRITRKNASFILVVFFIFIICKIITSLSFRIKKGISSSGNPVFVG